MSATGTLESILAQLTELNTNLVNVLANGGTTPAEPAEETASAPAKKVASKKVAAKTTAKRQSKAKGDDLSNMVIFKKALFEAAEKSGVEDVMPKLKKYLKAQGYGASDEIEVEDRVEFVAGVKAHFDDMADGDADDEDDGIDI